MVIGRELNRIGRELNRVGREMELSEIERDLKVYWNRIGRANDAFDD